METKTREAVVYYPSLGYLGLIVSGVIVWLPGEVARDGGLTS